MNDILSTFRLDGKVAVVTGASRGIGLGIAEALASAGADLALVSRSRKQLAANAHRIAEETNRFAFPVAADLTDRESIDRTVRQVIERFGRLDILVNSAGTNLREPSLDYTEEAWDAVMTLNTRTPFFMAQHCARAMLKSGGGSVINIASLLTFRGRGSVPAYAASKGGIGQLTKALAVEWAQYGIRVNAIAPGFIRTEMTAPLEADPEFNDWVLGRTPMKRWGEPEDLAGAAVFLASDGSRFVTGQVLAVDGGWLAG
jgi:2-deoxy-D-gluconate 3-dehydrogenase